jgi:hypothetical protein
LVLQFPSGAVQFARIGAEKEILIEMPSTSAPLTKLPENDWYGGGLEGYGAIAEESGEEGIGLDGTGCEFAYDG